MRHRRPQFDRYCLLLGHTFSRYKLGKCGHLGIPHVLTSALQQRFALTSEMFTTPLSVHPSTATYWTDQQEDEALGASFDAFSAPWSGAALVVPEHDDATLYKAVQYALDAAHSDAPALLILVTPHWESKKFHKLLTKSKHHAQVISAVPARSFFFTRPAHGPKQQPREKPVGWGVDIWLIANNDGLHRYERPNRSAGLNATLLSALQQSCTPNTAIVTDVTSRCHCIALNPLSKCSGFTMPPPPVQPTVDPWADTPMMDEFTAQSTIHEQQLEQHNRIVAFHSPPSPPRKSRALRRAYRKPQPLTVTSSPPAAWPQVIPLCNRARAFPPTRNMVYTDGSRKTQDPTGEHRSEYR